MVKSQDVETNLMLTSQSLLHSKNFLKQSKLHLYAASLAIFNCITQNVVAETSVPLGIVPKSFVATNVSVLTTAEAGRGTGVSPVLPARCLFPIQQQPCLEASLPQASSVPIVNEGQENTDSDDPMAQVTSVSQLRDVQPTDWAFQALQSLVERYGCIAGYPDRTYRGNRVLTRYQFAAGLNACLNRVNVMTTATSDLVRQADIATIRRLQVEFAVELTALRGRVDTLEAHTAQLEANQFSTTTKLMGQAIFAPNAGAFSGRRIIDSTGAVIANRQPNATFAYRADLDLNTSFNGTDLLKLRLDSVSDLGRDNATGFLEPNFGSVLEFTVRGTPNRQFGISRLYYTFTAVKDLSLTLGPSIVTTDFVDLNSYAGDDFGIVDFETLALIKNYLLFPINGPAPGAALEWNPGHGPFKLRALYAAGDGANPNSKQQPLGSVFALANLLYPNGGGSRGLFSDPYQGTAELEYAPSKAFAVRLQYSGGQVFNGRFDVFGANFELALNRQFAVFGRYGYGSYKDTAFGNINPNYWMAGVSLRDLFAPGASAGIAAGQPFIDRAVGNATQTNLEAFYNFPISDNIRVTPLIQAIVHPANQDANGTILTGTLRTVFSF